MKKFLSVTFAILFIVSLFTLNTSAASITTKGNTPTCKPGSEVVVSFSISANSGVGAIDIIVTYDKSVFTYVKHKNGFAFNGGMAVGNDLGDGKIAYAFIHTEGATNGGEMFNITFKVSHKAPINSKHEIKLDVNSSVDSNHKHLNVPSCKAVVTVGDSNIDDLPKEESQSVNSKISVNSNLNSRENNQDSTSSRFSISSSVGEIISPSSDISESHLDSEESLIEDIATNNASSKFFSLIKKWVIPVLLTVFCTCAIAVATVIIVILLRKRKSRR